MNTWRLAASNTHLYPGARLRSMDASARKHLQAGDAIVIEFADQGLAKGEVVEASAQTWALRLDAHTTARGAAIEAKRWLLQWLPPGELAGTMKIKARVS